MSELLAKFSGGELLGLIAIVLGALVAASAIIASQWRRVRVAEMEAALKQQMLDKGMSAAEVEQVMRASPGSGGSLTVASSGNEAVDKAALAQRMVEQGYEGEDIERVLKAYQPGSSAGEEKPIANRA